MNLKKVFLILLSLMFSQLISGQSISRSVIGSCGSTQSSVSNKISWSVGETVVGTMTGGQYQLANGFFPSLDYSILLTPEDIASKFIEVYPNPAGDFFICSNKNQNDMIITLIAANGKELFQYYVESDQKIFVSDLTNGIYFLQVMDQVTRKTGSYKLMINN